MEIRWRLYLYVVANCAYCVAKPVSLNEVIAAESQQKQLVHAASSKLEELTAQRISLNKGLKPLLHTSKKFKEQEVFIPLEQKSSLKYRKAFQIKSPLKPKRIKHILRKNNYRIPSVKREISGNEKLNRKYVPLLRSLGMLFDNLLAESGESTELRHKRKRVRYYTDTSEVLCPCSSKSNAKLQSGEEADSTEALSDETSPSAETPTKTPHSTPAFHLRSLRQNKNIPLLLSRNSLSGRRNNNGFGKRSGPAHYGSAERNLPGNHGDSKPGTGDGINRSYATDDEEDSGGHSRYHVHGFRTWRRIRDGSTSLLPRSHTEARSSKGEAIRKNESSESESTTEHLGGNVDKSKREDKQQVQRDAAESAELLSATVGRLRGVVPANEVYIPESEHEKNKSNFENNSGDQRPAHRNSSLANEDKETGTRHETVGFYNIPTISPDHSKAEPVVFIIDGYSVTRNKNGENKLKEKAIHIHSE